MYIYIFAAVALRWYVLSLRLLNQTIAETLQCVPATVARLHLPLRDLRHAAETLDMRIARHALRSNSTSTTWVCVCAWTKVKATSRQRGVWATLSSGSTTPVFHTLSCARSSENSKRIKSENLKKELNYKTIKKNIEQFNVLRAVYACCVVCVRCDLFKNQHTINELPGLAIKSISKLAYVNSKQTDLPPTWGNFNLSANFVFFFSAENIYVSGANIDFNSPSAYVPLARGQL